MRLYAEDPANNYLPSTGLLEQVKLQQTNNTLVDSGVRAGDSVTIHYDPMIAKLVVWAEDRTACIQQMQQLLNQSAIFGVKTNTAFLSQLIATKAFQKNTIYTNTLDNNEIDLSVKLPPAVVAIYVHHLLQSTEPTLAWQQANGWRIQGEQAFQLQFTFQNEIQNHSISWEDGVYLIDGQHHYLPQASDLCHVHRNQVQVVHNNLRYEFSLPDYEAKASVSDANVICAPMPGKIIEVKVKAGDAVTVGQTLIVMEAMKMELELKAERDAVIKNLSHKSADQVQADAVLVELEPK